MPIPPGGHSDWFFGLLSFIPRSSTAVAGPPPTDVTYSSNFDKEHHNPDVPNQGAWAVSQHPEYGLSFATVQKFQGDWWLLAVGTFRYDYADGYYTFPRLALKKIA